MARPEENDNGALEDLARLAFEPEPGIEKTSHDSIVEAVLSVTRVRSHIRLPELPSDESSQRSRSVPVDETEPEESFTRYEVQGKLARGGMGTILKGRDRQLGREVAIKVLEKRHASDPAMVERFIEEAQIGGQLQHPGIVPVLELGYRPDRRPYFAMKLVKGRTLGSLLKSRSDPGDDRRRFLDIFERVCQTMAYAHARSVVHRDLKPANIMVGAFGEVQVMDWGLAKVLGEDGGKRERDRPAEGVRTVVETVRSSGSDTRSHAGSVMGTPAYMPPEQARGDVDLIDERCDVFALGAILCEILTGKPPYTGDTFSEVRQKAQAGNLTDAIHRLEGAGLDDELDRIARTCLAQERDDRFPGAGAVADAFAAYLASVEERVRTAEVNVARAEARAVAERRVRKRTVVAAVSLVTAILLIAGGYFWTESGRRDRQRRADRNVIAALQSTTSAHEQALGASTGNATRWAEVTLAANRVKALAEDDDVDPELRERVDKLFVRVEKDAAAARAATAQTDQDQRMIARLDEIRTRVGDLYQFDYTKRDVDYAATFRDYGIDLASLTDEEVSERVAGSRITRHLVTALERWATARKRALGRGDPALPRLARLAAALDPDPLRKRVRAAIASGDLKALQTLARSPEVMALKVDDLDRMAQSLGRAGDPAGAVALLRAAHRKHPDDFWINYFLANWFRRTRPPRFEDAVRHASAAVSIRPRSASAWNLLGLVLMRAGRLDEAKTALDRALEIHPGLQHAVSHLGLLLCRQGKPKRAIEMCLRDIESRPGNAEIHFSLGLAYQDGGDVKHALEAYRQALELSPDLARARSNIGALLKGQGQFKEAEAAFRQAIQTDPTLLEAHVNLADLLLTTRRIEEAGEAIEKALEIDPEFGAAHNVHGHILTRSGHPDEAIEAYQKAIRLSPETSNHHNNLGVAYSIKGDLKVALRAFDAAIRCQPTSAGAFTNRGNILARMKRWGDALTAFRKSLDHAPDDPAVLIKVGNVLEQLYRFEEALDHFQRGHELGARRPDWKVDSADLIQKCEQRIEFIEKMDAIRDGEAEPTTARELYDLAILARFTKRYATAARFWRSGFKIMPRLARSRNLFLAASDAAMAGTGRGTDAETLDAKARAEWLHLSAVWLNRYVEALAEIHDKYGESRRRQVRQSLLSVQRNPGLDGLREARHLAVLSQEDQLRCIALWAEVEKLIEECQD